MSGTTQLATVAALLATVFFGVSMGALSSSRAHEDHHNFSAGEPGDPRKPSRTIRVIMFDDGTETNMKFEPALISVRKGEQIRFIMENSGTEGHEFILATAPENRKHAEVMRTFPEMQHHDPNGKRVPAAESDELIWKFTKSGEFEFACLIPGHYEAGMHGTIIVK